MDKFEQKEMKKIRPIPNNWHNWLFNYIPDLIRKSVDGFKDKIVSIFKTNTTKQAVCGTGKKLSKQKTQKQSEENIINNIRNLFLLKNEKKNCYKPKRASKKE